jgi:hypothetical protein
MPEFWKVNKDRKFMPNIKKYELDSFIDVCTGENDDYLPEDYIYIITINNIPKDFMPYNEGFFKYLNIQCKYKYRGEFIGIQEERKIKLKKLNERR